LPNASNTPSMPLSELQTRVLRLLARNRNPGSAVGGASPLSRAGARTSADVDIFHDRDEAVSQAALDDARTLTEAGFTVEWLRRDSGIWSVVVRDGDAETKLEWVHDSDFRFFPPVADDDFGYVLHPADIATNKVLAAAGRREPRDLVDLLQIHAQIMPMGAAIWAAVGKDPGWSPESLIAQIRRNGRYRDDDLAPLRLDPPILAADLSRNIRDLLDEAEAFVLKMPSQMAGLLFFEDGKIVQPDPEHLDRYVTHAGSRGGHWPSSSELGSAMLSAWKTRR